ncbi:lipopolysaccharide biosynthesis protein [Shinella kummerowiae]|uniref:lipopolysaccharide biosynthesis protein n=1 Tax=Shinella kummerowiae TaxID=417745 RepID=UPI0021B653C2|nr:lipopolysaccharide biosynthesis protein [Shinella kummerowiae]MCT7663225.1 lipopolysaccharide biosynthesis protein [Shinella kummerowiae]
MARRNGSSRATGPGARLPIGVLARNGVAAGVIKLASAGLSFLMLAAAAMVTDERQFGLYSTAYAGASLVSFFSLVGQHAVVLRFWPQYAGNDDQPAANALMARAMLVALAGLILSSLLVGAIAFLPLSPDVPEWRALCLASAVLAFALGWSEFTACALRAKNALFSGLLPRDIFWRAAGIAAFAATGLVTTGMSVVAATYLTALLLIACVLPQSIVLVRDTFGAARGALNAAQKAEFASVTFGLWGVTALPPALSQASTLLVAVILGPEAAGAIFVADRIMRLAILALTGINQAVAPQISGSFYRGDRPHVQRITGLTAMGGFSVALLMLAIFVLFGKPILAIFEPAYATDSIHAVLVILGIGALVGTACGPTELLLQLTGLQKALFRTLIVVNSAGLALTALLTYGMGPIGAALGIAGTLMAWCLTGVTIARRRLGIDPSILGFFTGPDASFVRTLLRGRA